MLTQVQSVCGGRLLRVEVGALAGPSLLHVSLSTAVLAAGSRVASPSLRRLTVAGGVAFSDDVGAADQVAVLRRGLEALPALTHLGVGAACLTARELAGASRRNGFPGCRAIKVCDCHASSSPQHCLIISFSLLTQAFPVCAASL